MRWCAAGYEQTFETLTALLATTAWPGPPVGFAALTPPRPMRAVLGGTLAGPDGPERVVLKWSRPDAVADLVSKRVRGGKGPREGRALRAMQTAGVPAPRPLAFGDDGEDWLLTAALTDLAPLPAADAAARDLVRRTAVLLARAHGAGLRHRDLHRGNLGGVGAAAEPTLVDLGGARIGAPLAGARRLQALARIRHGVLDGARRSQRFRALCDYMEAAHGDRDRGRQEARSAARDVEALARIVARRYRRGRDRRATRMGKHFEVFDGTQVARAVRRREGTDASWHALAEAWLGAEGADGARPLKAGGGVLRVPVPGEGRFVVCKQFEGVAPTRLPRPLRMFRCAYALENRRIPAPRALLAATRSDGSGICVSEWVEGENLHAFSAGGRGGALAALSRPARRQLLERLGRSLRALHDAEITHRDLKAPNLLVQGSEGRARFWFADLEGVGIRRRAVPWARRAKDLARLDASLDARPVDRVRVLRAYMGVWPKPPVTTRALAKRIAQHVRKKRGPAGKPR